MENNETQMGRLGYGNVEKVIVHKEQPIYLVRREKGLSSIYWYDEEGFRWRACPDFDEDEEMIVDVVKQIAGFYWG